MAILLFGGVMLYCLNPTDYRFMPKCPIKLITGLSCPGCGIQRAVHASLHGNCMEAIKYNFFLLYSVPYAMSFVVVWAMPESALRGKIRKVIENRRTVNSFIVAFSAWFVIRNILNI